MTGSYHNYFRIYDVNSDNDVVLQADKSAFKAKKIGGARGKVPGKKEGMQTDGIDFAKKIVSTPSFSVHLLTPSYMEVGTHGRTQSLSLPPTTCSSIPLFHKASSSQDTPHPGLVIIFQLDFGVGCSVSPNLQDADSRRRGGCRSHEGCSSKAGRWNQCSRWSETDRQDASNRAKLSPSMNSAGKADFTLVSNPPAFAPSPHPRKTDQRKTHTIPLTTRRSLITKAANS